MNDKPKDDTDEQSAGQTALELLRQIIALSSGVLALSAAFIEKFSQRNPAMLVVLGVSWLCLVASVFCGLQAMSAMVKSISRPEFHWSRAHLRTYARASKYTFVLGLALFAIFAFVAFMGKTLEEGTGSCSRASRSSGVSRPVHGWR